MMEAAIAIVPSSALREDGELLMKILPERYQQETPLESSSQASSVCFHAAEPHSSTLVLLSTVSKKNGSPRSSAGITAYATLYFHDDKEILEIAERSSTEGISVEETFIGESRLAKLKLPGGCCVTLTTPLLWLSATNRAVAIDFITDEESKREDLSQASASKIGRRFVPMTPPTGQKRSIANESIMRRSLSLPSLIPPLVTTRSTYSQNSIFPTIRSRVLSMDGVFSPFPLNSQTPVPVETEFFVGQMLLIMRPKDPPHEDQFWNERIFCKKKRRVDLRLQGKLKIKPEGTLMAGMEISNPMKLGLIASGLCNIILKMIKSFNPAIHYSFGTAGREHAHITFPASTFFERLVVSPPGETPPDIKMELEEDPQVAKARKGAKTKIDWNTEDTYSMSFHSMYIDFPSWSVVQLPVGKDISLQTFWGDSNACVVLYETPQTNSQEDRHLIANNRYFLSVEMKFLGNNAPVLDDKSSDVGSEWSEDQLTDVASTSPRGDAEVMPPLDEGTEEEELEFFDTVESQTMLPAGALVDVDFAPTGPHHSVLRMIDEFCPCWIDMYPKKGKYQTVYVFNGAHQRDRPLFRTSKMVEDAFGKRNIVEVDDRFSSRMSAEERMRRIAGLKYAEAHVEMGKRRSLHQFETVVTGYDRKFLARDEHSVETIPGVLSGLVARALSDRHWIEERVVLQDKEIVFYHVERSKIHFCISLSSVLGVSIPKGSDAPCLHPFVFLQIETFGRVTYVMFSSAGKRDSWLEAIRGLTKMGHPSSRSFTNHLFEADNPMEEFQHKSTMWDCQKRRILNCRKFSFQTPKNMNSVDTLQLAEIALSKVMALQPKGPDHSDLCEFLNSAAALKDADAYSLNEKERLAFFLNVYHIFIMHAYIVLSPPDSSLKWINYFNTIAYQVSDDVFSLAELEHNIIRAQMSNPSQFFSRFVLPKSHYMFALTRPDFRINFALNPGSLSMPCSAVPIYRPERVDKQLDATTRRFLSSTVTVRDKGAKDVIVSLPRVCQWFEKDFGPNGSANDVLVVIRPFLSPEIQDTLQSIWNDKKKCYEIGVFNLRYLPYNYECRFLTLLVEEVI